MRYQRLFPTVLNMLPIALVLLTASCTSLHVGDLLFHVVDNDNAITSVTPDRIDHVAICISRDSVIEAIPSEGVTTTPLHQLLQRDGGYYVVGRVKHANIRHSVNNARAYQRLPYDSLYLPATDAIYCSELVLLSYVDRHGNRLLHSVPMTFRDSTNQIPLFWQQLYERHSMPVPEGEPGSNPSELAHRKEIKKRKSIKP